VTDQEACNPAADHIMRWMRIIFVAVIIAMSMFIGMNRLTVHQACENNRSDRIDNAAGWTAHREYIKKVTGAASVKEDVKHAARTANQTYTRISTSLTKRADIDCGGLLP
jgi:Na+-transporting NADH:ubiquinone oxidoreductase subunit NqrB